MLEAVIQYGTGRAAALGQFAAGKTGTTSNYGDAWFVGWNSKYTVAVWVGYPDKLVPMTTDFNGQPVLGGTYPALIWHQFMVAASSLDKARAEHSSAHLGATGPTGGEETSTAGGGSEASGGSSTSAGKTPGANPGTGHSTGETGAGTKEPPPAPATPETPTPSPPAATPPSSGAGPGGEPGSGSGSGGTPAG